MSKERECGTMDESKGCSGTDERCDGVVKGTEGAERTRISLGVDQRCRRENERRLTDAWSIPV